MNGGLLRSCSRLAILAAAGLFAGGVAMPSAKAADLGGDCCADLEERVAELEATTARKGNRKMSLTITGQVNRMVMYWDDGVKSGTFYGLDNTMSSTRFSFLGEAKVTPNVKMGFEIMMEIEAGGTGSKASQFDEDGKLGGQVNGAGAASFNAGNVDSFFGDARRAAFWIEDKNLGRVTVGRYESAGVVTTIDLAGIGQAANAANALIPGFMFLRLKNGNGDYSAIQWGNLGDTGYSQGRSEVLRYDSPSWAGFIFSASVGEAGDYWGAMLRYAGEFSGFRIAAGIGYENAFDTQTDIGAIGSNPTLQVGRAGPSNLVGDPGEVRAWGGGLSVLHVPSGLFAQGHYDRISYDAPSGQIGVGGPLGTGYWNQQNSVTPQPDATQWFVQGGIMKNWFGLGNTSLYGEYGVSSDWGALSGAGRSFSAANTPGALTVAGVTSTDFTVWGLGIVQQVDAAATTLYLTYRNFSADIDCATACLVGGVATGKSVPIEDFQYVTAGAVVKF
jgi:hypothetical protein